MILTDSIYRDSADFGDYIYSFSDTVKVTIEYLTIQNINGTGANFDDFIVVNANDEAVVLIDSLKFDNTNIGIQYGIRTFGKLSLISITNSNFTNLMIGEENALISIGETNSIFLSNLIFSNVMDQYPTDDANYMIIFNVINLKEGFHSAMRNISVSNSKVNFLSAIDIDGEVTETVYMNITNLVYSDCYFENKENLLSFSRLETDQDFRVFIDQLVFTNLTFTHGGKLFELRQQFIHPVVFTNLRLYSIIGGQLHLESANKNDLSRKTRVLIQNSEFQMIDSNYGSIIELNEGAQLEIQS